MPAALMIGHHFSISALWNAASASGVLLLSGENLLRELLPQGWVHKGCDDVGIQLRVVTGDHLEWRAKKSNTARLNASGCSQ